MATVLRPRALPAPASYTTLFESERERLPGKAAWLRDLRRDGLARFAELGFPTPRVEAWKYSNLARLAKLDFARDEGAADAGADLAPYFIEEGAPRRLVFVNGRFDPKLSRVDGDDIVVRELATALEDDDPELRNALLDSAADRSLSALNAAFVDGGVYVRVPDGVEAERPVHVLHLSRGGDRPTLASPRHVVLLGRGAKLRLIETFVSAEAGDNLVNLTARYALGDDAELIADRLQLGDDTGFHIGRSEIEMGARARMRQTTATLAGSFVRNETAAALKGSEIDLQLNGLFFPRGTQHVDTAIRIDHERPNCVSDQFYKGVLDGRGHAAFAGKIMVHRPAQKTNAYQSNNNLILSGDAAIDTKPELEIYADDVKCSHGATAGELDGHELFYLRSRGLDALTARSLLTFAFMGKVIERFGFEEAAEQARRGIFARLPGGEALLRDMAA